MRCIIIDDEPGAIKILEKYVSRYPGLIFLKSFTDAVEAFNYVEENKRSCQR